MAGGETADAQQGHCHRSVGAFGEFAQLVHRAAQQHAMPGQDHRSFGGVDHFHALAGYRFESGRKSGR